MNKLLAANFTRLRKDITFYLCLLAMFALGVFLSLKTDASVPVDSVFFVHTYVAMILSAVFTSLYVGTEYSDGTLRNKLVVGHSRLTIYASMFVTCAAATLAMCLSFILPVCVLGFIRLGFFDAGTAAVMVMCVLSLMAIVACVAVFTLISMLISNKATGAVICILLVFVLLFSAIVIQSRLEEPPYYAAYSYTDTTGTTYEDSQPNENYLTGAKREAFEFFFDLLPTGQAMQISSWDARHIARMLLCSCFIILSAGSSGMLVFRKKDIK